MTEQPRVVIVTGMSGAGRSQAANVLEDAGYFVVDNLPPSLITAVVNQADVAEKPRYRLAVVVDTRGGLDFGELEEAILSLRGQGVETSVLFLDASDAALIRRFEETRRRHPVDASTLSRRIAIERKALEELRGQADIIVDTSDLNVHQLRDKLRDGFTGIEFRRSMQVDVTSFGFKKGVPRVLDLLFDVRFLPNPHWQEELRPLTGKDAPVRDYVMSQPDTAPFLEQVTAMLEFLLPKYETEGKSYLTIGIGCTGGQHRSVAIAEEVAGRLLEQGVDVSVDHRDLPSWAEVVE